MDDEEKKEEFKPWRSAQVLWPPDMPDEMLDDAIACTENAFKENKGEIKSKGYVIAEQVKKHMDAKWEPHWHVFLGKSFGCHSVHEKNRFVYFTMQDKEKKCCFLIYKAN